MRRDGRDNGASFKSAGAFMSFQRNVRGFFAALARAFAFMRAALGNILVLLVLLLLVVPVLMLGAARHEVPAGAALAFAPEHITEQRSPPGFSPFSGFSAEKNSVTTVDAVKAIERAAQDNRIETLAIDLSKLASGSFANVEAIGAAIKAFRAAGKTAVAFADAFGQGQYQLASFADEVYLHPFGVITFSGFPMYRTYYGGLLERLKINVHVFQMGEYKSAAESYARSDMSPAAREASQFVANGLWDEFVAGVAANRDLTPEAINRYATEYDALLTAAAGDAARAALEHGLVDELITGDALRERLVSEVGSDGNGGYLHTTLADYLESRPDAAPSGNLIAVVVAEGPILMGKQPRGRIGGESTSALIRKAREDDAVEAIVLRVHSPGGSAFASEQVREEVELAQTAGKPVVASMGGVAASGGYWISATADEIWAAPTTITGSIGVIGLALTMEDALGEFGVATDGVDTNAVAGDYDPGRPLSERYGNVVRSNLDFVYRRFVNLVARGRDLSVERVDALARGRIWTGRQALERGLVDGLGDRSTAVAAAARLAELDEYQVKLFETELSPQDELLLSLADRMASAAAPQVPQLPQLTQAMDDWATLATLSDPRHVYAICEACPEF